MAAAELDDALYEQIQELSEEGNVLVDNDDFIGALGKFEKALALVPDPKTDWEAGMWLYASIGDMYYFLEEYRLAADSFYNALNCPEGQQSAFVHLRLGESLYELEDRPKALDHLLRAYMLEGKEIFEEEEEEYFEFLKDNVEGIGDDNAPPPSPEDPPNNKFLPPDWN